MVKDMWVTHGMMSAMCQATKREMTVSEKGEEISPVGLGDGEKQKEEKRERKGENERKRRGRRERKIRQLLPLICDISTVGVHRAEN